MQLRYGQPSTAGRRLRTPQPFHRIPPTYQSPKRFSTSAAAPSTAAGSTGGANKPGAWVPPKGILKINPELLKSGGLNVSQEGPQARASFDSHLSSLFVPVNLDHPGLRILNIDPPVLTVEGFLTAGECDEIVAAALGSGLMRQSEVGWAGYAPTDGDPKAAAKSSVRTSSTLAATKEVLTSHPQIAAAVGAMLSRARGLLRGPLPPEGAAAYNRPSGPGAMSFELPQVARYQPGQHFLTHEDAFPINLVASKGYQRRATLLVYLNDCEEGGATKFDILDIAVQPKKGSALLFFPAFSNGFPDKRTLHTATDAVTEKWVTQLWLAGGVKTAAQQQPTFGGKPSGPPVPKGRKRGVQPQRINTKI